MTARYKNAFPRFGIMVGYMAHLSLEQERNSTADSTTSPLTQSVCPVKVAWQVPAFHILMVLSAEPGDVAYCF